MTNCDVIFISPLGQFPHGLTSKIPMPHIADDLFLTGGCNVIALAKPFLLKILLS